MIALLTYCRLAQAKGLSMNASLELYRAAGGRTRREVFGLAWRAVTDQAAAAELGARTAAA